MKLWERWLFHVSTIVLAVSGVAYFVMKYFIENDDPFSVVNHPWQPLMLSLHVVAAPVLVFVTGLIVQSHIRKKLDSGGRSNRSSGLASMVSLPVMIVSGYLLQVVSSPLAAQIVLVFHIGSSVVFLVTYIAHQIGTLRLRTPAESGRTPVVSRRQLA
jgi:hypothetical protein